MKVNDFCVVVCLENSDKSTNKILGSLVVCLGSFGPCKEKGGAVELGKW